MPNKPLKSIIKYKIRQLLPKKLQVPLKFHFNAWNKQLEQEFDLLPFIIRKGDNVVDIGGNRGAYAYALYKLGANIRIFEPNKDCALILSAWAKNKMGVEVHQLALSNKKGSATLNVPVDSSGVVHDSSASLDKKNFKDTIQQEVNICTLDEFNLKEIKLIKIDVEGHEFNVIEGAINTIKLQKPALLIEIEKRHLDRPFEETFNLLERLGYKTFFMKHGVLQPFENFNVSLDQTMRNASSGTGNYINNFLFLHDDLLGKDTYKKLIENCFLN